MKDVLGKKVTDGYFEFYVKEIEGDFAVMDNSKPFKALDKDNPMVTCLESGHYKSAMKNIKLIMIN